jgi:hypothetical protein
LIRTTLCRLLPCEHAGGAARSQSCEQSQGLPHEGAVGAHRTGRSRMPFSYRHEPRGWEGEGSHSWPGRLISLPHLRSRGLHCLGGLRRHLPDLCGQRRDSLCHRAAGRWGPARRCSCQGAAAPPRQGAGGARRTLHCRRTGHEVSRLLLPGFQRRLCLRGVERAEEILQSANGTRRLSGFQVTGRSIACDAPQDAVCCDLASSPGAAGGVPRTAPASSDGTQPGLGEALALEARRHIQRDASPP